MNKKEMQKKIENQKRHIASLQRTKAALETKERTKEAQLSTTKNWIDALAARIGNEFELEIDEIKNPPEYECKYDQDHKKIMMRQKCAEENI